MKDLLKKPITFEKVEFWIATVIYGVSLYILAYNQFIQISTGDLNTPNVQLFEQHHLYYSYSKFYFIPQHIINATLYCSFLLLNFYTIKRLANNRNILLNLFLSAVIFILAMVVIGTADTWIESYRFYHHSEHYVYRFIFRKDFVFGIWVALSFGFYTGIKYTVLYLIGDNTYAKANQVIRECIVALSLLCLSIIFLIMMNTGHQTVFAWCEVILTGIALYWYSFTKLIPGILAKNELFGTYILKGLQLAAILFFPLVFLALPFLKNGGDAMGLTFFNIGINAIITLPATWALYQHRLSKNQELQGLKTALGSSTANLDFLRSQINPHFLFNALNTLYGTSLQENAERTGEGIQKLGDMMRFMLQENMQEKISLTREVDYLNNYIDLQKLRTQTSPDILINTEIEAEINGLEIAPMLLIPFVENAFKHGISLREPSHIKISLQMRDYELLFDVYNSIHPKAGNDPEKNKSGIGLENVKQRLQLLYPKRHELVIRESAKEFFIHLTIQLS